MERKVKVKLTEEHLITFFVRFTCCNEIHHIKQEKLMDEKADGILCSVCGEPKMLRGPNDLWYYVGGRVFE
jgi:hypothetical protein